jgi:hypothetical protein
MARFTKPKISAKLLRRKVSTTKREDLGKAGRPVNTSHPFYFGFMVTIGALLALTMLQALASASAVFILIIISLLARLWDRSCSLWPPLLQLPCHR